MAAKNKLNYSEGDCFMVPLCNGGFARCVIARMDGRGLALGYFFGPRLISAIKESGCEVSLVPSDAVLIKKFGDLGIIEGKWNCYGHVRNWNRNEWPMPIFIRVDDVAKKAWLCHYDEDNFDCMGEELTTVENRDNYPQDSTSGYGAIEQRLTTLLGN